MTIIKRYPNRKLYNTDAKQYITLEGIADLIREGSEIQVIDNATGEDLTALTLTQIILEQEKKQSGFLPNSFLTNLIRSSEDRLSSLQRNLPSPGNFWRQIEDQIEAYLQQRHLPSHDDIQQLTKQIDDLTARIEALQSDQSDSTEK